MKKYPTANLDVADFPLNPEKEYEFVLVRYDRDPSLTYRVQNYTENQASHKLRLHGEVVPAVYVRTKYLRDRAWRLGWVDVTEECTKDNYWRKPGSENEQRIEKLLSKSYNQINTSLKLAEQDDILEEILAAEQADKARPGVIKSLKKRIEA